MTNVVTAVAVQPDGKILSVGWVADTTGANKTYDFAVLRFGTDGAPAGTSPAENDVGGAGIRSLYRAGPAAR